MREFKDTKGRTWKIEINNYQVDRLRTGIGIDLLGAKADAGLGELIDDPIKLGGCIYLLCEDQAKSAGITPEDFGKSLGGDANADAMRAFIDEVIDFFPSPRREPLRRAMEKLQAVQDAIGRQVTSRLDAIDPEKLASLLISANTPGSLPASSASIPAPSPSGS